MLGSAFAPAVAQTRAAVEQERSSLTGWLEQAPLSPRRAVVVRPIGPGLTVGPSDADIPLAGVSRGRIAERSGRVTLELGAETLALPRGRPLTWGGWLLLSSGPAGRAAITVYRAEASPGTPARWFPWDSAGVFMVSLAPGAGAVQRVLGADGVEVDATEAGTVTLLIDGSPRILRVFRMPGASDEEAELEIYFQDRSNGNGTYPSGRFVSLLPGVGGRYLLDLNRARNPFCAYNTVFPCPAPWRGNAIPSSIRAGERYDETVKAPRRPG